MLFNKMVQDSLNETIERMQKEIIEDVIAGLVPIGCSSFSSLDDCRDANAYGGFCEDERFDALIIHFGGRDENEGMPEGMMSYISQARDATDTWLKAGGLETECPPPEWNYCVGNDSFNPWGYKPFNELFDKNIGGNGYPTCGLTVLKEGSGYRAAHGSVVMPELFVRVSQAADHAMTWAVENGWSVDDLKNPAKLCYGVTVESLVGKEAPVPAFSPFLDHASYAEYAQDSLLRLNAQKEGFWSGKVLDVERGIVIQKINRDSDTVTHDASKLSQVVKVGDVVDIKYVGGVGVVSGLDRGLVGVGR